MKKLIVILGINGELGSSIANHHSVNTHDTNLLGIDIHDKSFLEHLTFYFSCDFGNRIKISETLEKLPLDQYNEIIFIVSAQ